MKLKYHYRLEVSHRGRYDDERLNTIVGRKYSDFSGSGLGQRDVGWYFNHQKQAFAAFSKLRKLKKLTHLSVNYDKYED